MLSGAARQGTRQNKSRRTEVTHTMATPRMTTRTDVTTELVKTRPNQNFSTRHTKGMISSLAICTHPTAQLLWSELL